MFVDSHAHIYSSEFDIDRSEIINLSLEKDVKKIYMPNVDSSSIDRMLEAEDRYKGICIPMMGLHPCSVGKNFEKSLYEVEAWLNKRKFAAVGEIGIDLFHDVSFFEQQKEAFLIQVQWAIDYKMPIVIHCRNSFRETVDALSKFEKGKIKGVFHCFSGTLEEAHEVIDMGFYLGIGGVATFKNGGLDKVIPEIELEHIVLETDSPYLAPAPFRGKRNHPGYIPLVAEKIATYKNVGLEEIAEITTANIDKVFAKV
ncbi:MAG: TatD family hydrolase [Cytophagaceae bacterium]